MSDETTYCCDRCGKPLNAGQNCVITTEKIVAKPIKYSKRRLGQFRESEEFFLCSDCYEEVRRYLTDITMKVCRDADFYNDEDCVDGSY